jgi:hypothetical protein
LLSLAHGILEGASAALPAEKNTAANLTEMSGALRHNIETQMTHNRGREARLKAEYARLYPGLDPDVWMPVEALLRHVTELIHADRTKSPVITGTRLLRQEHFEYRGSSVRPEGLPTGLTRLSDSGTEPGQ